LKRRDIIPPKDLAVRIEELWEPLIAQGAVLLVATSGPKIEEVWDD
jgi:hypothetical protein